MFSNKFTVGLNLHDAIDEMLVVLGQINAEIVRLKETGQTREMNQMMNQGRHLSSQITEYSQHMIEHSARA